MICNKDRHAVETVFLVSTLLVLFSCCVGALPFTVKPDEVATVFGKAFTYKLPAEMSVHPGYTFKFHALDSSELPSWLEFVAATNLFVGVPSSHHDKGSHTIRLDVINDETNKTIDTINFLTIEVVEYEEDLNHFRVLRTNTLTEPNKNTSKSSLNCPNRAPVIVATLVFDLTARKLSGAKRVELLNSVSKWTDIDVSEPRWMPGKGEKTAFNLEEVIVLTAGPGGVRDPQERGVAVSWKIGCGDSITESEKSYGSVSHLKSASQTGAFGNELNSPVIGWHVTYGRVKRRRVVRVRRQAQAQTPVPTSAFVTPTASIATHVIGTPTMTKSPIFFTATPTATRVVPSTTQVSGPSATIPTHFTTPYPINTPPFLKTPIALLTANVDQPFSFDIPRDTFDDKEDGPTPNLLLEMFEPNGNPIETWVKLDSTRQTLHGIPKSVGDTRIALIVTDSGNLKSMLHVVTIRVIVPPTPTPPRNDPPFIHTRIGELTVPIDEPFSFNVPPDTFRDREDGATPNLQLDMYDPNGDPIDTWVTLDTKFQILHGTPKSVGETKIGLIVTDSGNLKSKLHVVTIRVVVPNKPPYLYNHIDLISLYIGQPIAFKVPHDTFHDAEDGSTGNLTLSMRTADHEALDEFPWVEFDAKTQIIYALPVDVTIGKYEFLMFAFDRKGLKAIDAFEFHINPTPVTPNHQFGLVLAADYKKFEKSAETRVKLCLEIGNYFGDHFNTSYSDIRVEKYEEGSIILVWNFANIATNITGVNEYKSRYILGGESEKPVNEFKNRIESSCPISTGCSVTKVWVNMLSPESTTVDPNVVGRTDDDDDGTWWEYTIIPAFVVAALILIIGLIIIICIRCRRKTRLEKNENVVFVQRKKPAVFREEYPMREVYGNQPLITPNEKAPLPPPAYPRSSTPTEDPSERLLSDSSPSYQPPFDSGHEPAGNSRPSVASYRLPPPYVAP